jgi:hypothetical protein
MNELAKDVLNIANQMQADVHEQVKPPSEGEKPKTQDVVDFTLVKGTRRNYLERVVHQINGAYEHGWYDACAVMLRRFVETLIIEAFEENKIASKIQDSNGNYLYLKDLISLTLSETTWTLGRNAKNALPKLKDIGDQSAHSRRFNANRSDIEKLLPDIRTVVQELISIAKLK